MENASKALIIAGAILLAIAIIGIGMAVYNNAADSISGADMTEEEVTAYNASFNTYEGRIRGSRAKTLVNTVKTHNLAATDDSEKIQVLLDSSNTDSEVNVSDVDSDSTETSYLQEVASEILSGQTYNVTFGYDSSSGMITTVYINQVS